MTVMTKQLRIGIACNVFGFSGGMERYAVDIAKEFSQRGFKVIIFAKKADRSLQEELGLEVHVASLCRLAPGKLQPLLFSKWLEQQKSKVDVMIGCCRNAVSDIYICGGTHIGFLKNCSKTPEWHDKLSVRLEKQSFAAAKIVVAHSLLMERELIGYYGLNKTKIVTAFPPVAGDCFSRPSEQERNNLRSKFGFADDKKHFLFVSSSHERKGYPLLEEYFSKTDLPIDLLVAGRPIPAENDHIRYLGYRKDIEDLYKAVDFTILASTYEPFGLVGVESVLCGTPVVLAENIGCCDAIADSAKTTFAAGDLKSLDQAIRTVLGSPVHRCETTEILSPTSVAEHVDILEKLVLLCQREA